MLRSWYERELRDGAPWKFLTLKTLKKEMNCCHDNTNYNSLFTVHAIIMCACVCWVYTSFFSARCSCV